MFKKMFLIFICLCSVVSGEFQQITFDNIKDPATLEKILRERFSFEGNTHSFRNGLTIDNATNNVFEWNENSEELIWTFAANAINLTSTSGVVTMNFGAIVPTSNQLLLTPVSTVVGTVEGTIYYDSDTNNFLGRNDSTLVDLGAAAAGNSLDGAYNAGNTIDVDGSPVTMTTSDTDNNRVLDVVQNDTTNNPEAMRITNTGSGDTLQFVSTGGNDIDGTGSTWFVTSAGALTAVSGTIPTLTVNSSFTLGAALTMANGGTILNDTDTEIEFAENGEDISFVFTSNTVTLATDSGVDTLAMGVVDDLSGVGTITFDQVASTITLAANGAGDDLTIQVTNAQDATLALRSAGTAANAMELITTAGGMDFTNGGAAGGEDTDITASLASINLSASEAVQDAITLATPAGGMNFTSAATFDIVFTTTGGKFLVNTSEAATDQFKVDAQGTGAGAVINLETTNGGILLNADNADNGDITLDAADTMTFTSVDTKIFDGAAAETWIIEGTSNGTDATIVFTDPTANITWTFPTGGADTVAIVASTLATNYPEIANSVTGGTNQLIFEGTDADTEEAVITATDPTADIIWTLPDGGASTVSFVASTLATNFPDIANSVTGGTNQLIFEGSDADTEEAVITATDPTADIIWTLPDGGASTVSFMASTLATNFPEIANSVTGGTAQLVFEGTANDFETFLTATDPTADQTLTLPDDIGSLSYTPTGKTTSAADSLAQPITHAIVEKTTGGDAESLTLANGENGQVLVITLATDGGGDATLAPTTTTGWTSVLLADAGDTVTLFYVDDTVGWTLIGCYGLTAQPAVTQ